MIHQKKSKILKGFNVSFGKVDNPEDLRALIKSHSGNVLEYVSKTVSHVISGTDTDSILQSQPKIQAAAAKQVPVVSEKYIYDCIASGRLLNEHPYLVSDHPYNNTKFR